MKKHFLSLIAIVSTAVLTAFFTTDDYTLSKSTLTYITETHVKKTNTGFWAVFEYIGGPHYSPSSYVKISDFVNIDDYCPGSNELCAIYAEEDLFSNPGHPSQASLNYLLYSFGFYYYFPYEVSGLIEFKWIE